MAQVHGIAGEWARVKGSLVSLWPCFLAVFALGFAAGLLVCGVLLVGLGLLAAALVMTCWSLLRGLKCTESFFVGARGEERVSGLLADLPASYHVFNDFVAEGLHVDHVVVGPAGVFAVETKNWRGRVTVEENHVLVDGHLPSRAPLAQAQREAKAVRRTLTGLGWDGPVTPILVFASDTFRERLAEAQGVVVINSCEIPASFSTGRIVLPPAELSRLVSLMENNR